MWNLPDNKRVDPHWLNFEVDRVILERDACPSLFTTLDGRGNSYLAYMCYNRHGIMRFLITSTNETIICDLLFGNICVRDAITTGNLWVFDVNYEWQPTDCWKVQIDDVSATSIPAPGVMLSRRMRSIVRNYVTSASTSAEYSFRITTPSLAGV